MLNRIKKWWNPEPVYSEVGQRLWELLKKEEEWETRTGAMLKHLPTGIYLHACYYHRNHTWIWEDRSGVDCFMYIGESLEQKNFTGLTKHDHFRLYRRVADIVDRRVKVKWAEEKVKGELWIREALGLEVVGEV